MANIKDVARMAHVSVATVSRVINKKGYVSAETKRIVEEAIDELNYIPNQLARTLYSNESGLIAVIVPHINTAYYAELIESIEELAIQSNYKILLCNTKDDEIIEREYLEIFKQYKVDGIIYCVHTKNHDELINLNIPMITIDNLLADDIAFVSSDNTGGAIAAGEFLITNGAKNIAHFGGPSDVISSVERANGFKKAMKKHNMDYKSLDLDLVVPDKNLLREFLTNNKVDGIFCSSDYIALETIYVAKELGLRVPDDVQVIGFDNIRFSNLSNPPLTTIDQNTTELGHTAIKNLLLMINKEEIDSKRVVLPTELVKRGTTK